MSLLTDQFIYNMLGGAINGVKKYDAVAPDAISKAQYISMADQAVVASAKKGGYLTISSTNPSSGEALTLLQSMSFKVWIGIAYGYSKEVTVAPELARLLPDHTALYDSNPANRIDIPGFDRDPHGGIGGADMINGALDVTPSEPRFTLEKLKGY